MVRVRHLLHLQSCCEPRFSYQKRKGTCQHFPHLHRHSGFTASILFYRPLERTLHYRHLLQWLQQRHPGGCELIGGGQSNGAQTCWGQCSMSDSSTDRMKRQAGQRRRKKLYSRRPLGPRRKSGLESVLLDFELWTSNSYLRSSLVLGASQGRPDPSLWDSQLQREMLRAHHIRTRALRTEDSTTMERVVWGGNWGSHTWQVCSQYHMHHPHIPPRAFPGSFMANWLPNALDTSPKF